MRRATRRAILRGWGGILISLPALEAGVRLEGLATAAARDRFERAVADTGGERAKRFVALMCPNGVYPSHWFPSGGERDFILNKENTPLEGIRQHLVLLKGVANKVAMDAQAAGAGNGHVEGVQSLLTGWAPVPRGGNVWKNNGGRSIDQELAEFFARNGFVSRARGIHLGEEGVGGSYNTLSVQESGDAEGATNVNALFDSPAAMQVLENARLRNRSVLDGSKADFEKLARRVSGVDKQRVDAHLEALRSIEQRLKTASTCVNPGLATPMNGDERRDLFFDILTAAFACDASRTATVLFHHSGGGGPKLPWINVFSDIHELSHQIEAATPNAEALAAFDAYHQWWSRKTLRFVQNLKNTATAEGGSLLDETVIFQGSDIAWAHRTPDMPFLIIAGAKTPFATGRFVQFAPKMMHTHLLTTILHAFGHPAQHVGDPQYPPGNLDAKLLKTA